jgi:hypothetical protein
MKTTLRAGCVISVLILAATAARAELPESIVAKGETLIGTFHAEGAQVYECKADAGGKLMWQFREPVATLIVDGETVGMHYAGPRWELNDGSKILGKAVGRAPGKKDNDIPLLRLEATAESPRGLLAGINTILRINTKGGVASGACEAAGRLLSVPYSADYVVYRKLRWSLIPDASGQDMPRAATKK